MSSIFETVLLLALPASGKSEVRRYLDHVSTDARRKDFRMGESVQLDDYPYVHMMRRIDDELAAKGKSRTFFQAPDKPFRDANHWGTLIELLNEDHADMVSKKKENPASAARRLLERIDAAAKRAGARTGFGELDPASFDAVCDALEKEAREMLAEKHANYPPSLEGRTLVIEFSRGGPDGASMPLPAPLGYAYALSRLSTAILEKAIILYIWVSPEESRRKNSARTDPNDPGSILHHGVPLEVMLKDYGCDDIDHLLATSERPGTATIRTHGRSFHVPVARFDNRVDKTSFLRGDSSKWTASEIGGVHEGLRSALQSLP